MPRWIGFVFASQTETQGLVIAEAMAAGNPVVALDGPGVREIVRDGENGFLLEHDASPGEFATALGRLMGDLELTERLAAERAAHRGGVFHRRVRAAHAGLL